MISRVFINRPRLAAVISIFITLAGIISLYNIPVAQYPQITPPEIRVTAVYPGASGQELADTVAAPIEKEVNGVDSMLYMSSTCSNAGTYTLAVTFEVGTDPDIDQVNLQNRVKDKNLFLGSCIAFFRRTRAGTCSISAIMSAIMSKMLWSGSRE